MYLGLTGMKKRRDALKCTEWFITYLDLEEHVHLVTVYSNTTLQSCKAAWASLMCSLQSLPDLLQHVQPHRATQQLQQHTQLLGSTDFSSEWF